LSEVTFHRLDYERVLQRLREYALTELATRPEVREVILFGSLAKGTWSASSDADVVVIVDHASERGPFRGTDYAPRSGVGVGVDVLVYTGEETKGWGPRFRAEVEQGIVLYRRAYSPRRL
jgi:predicted nucleotidyltransferase